jgi:hexulose-6-phosphate isomerase
VPYQQAYWRSQTELRKVLPTAERLEVRLAVENVWNRFLWSPLEFAQYLDEFYSPWIGAYLDLGNTLTYGWPQQWIRILGSRIVKLDLKDRSRAQYDERGQAIRTKLGKGDANWAAILAALDEIGYTGWGTAEVAGGGPERMVEISQNMDQILSG